MMEEALVEQFGDEVMLALALFASSEDGGGFVDYARVHPGWT
jgi:hypothetical protein